MILWGLAVQTKGLGIWFVCSMKPLMADCKLDDGSEDAALQALLGELGEVALHGVEPRAGEVGANWKVNRLWRASQARTAGCL